MLNNRLPLSWEYNSAAKVTNFYGRPSKNCLPSRAEPLANDYNYPCRRSMALQMWADAPECRTKGQTTDRNHLNSMFYTSQPNIRMFVGHLFKVQAFKYIWKRSLKQPAEGNYGTMQSCKGYNVIFFCLRIHWYCSNKMMFLIMF